MQRVRRERELSGIPSWIVRARRQWKYRGTGRPAFAEPVGEGQESVWDYPRPPAIQAESREVLVKWQGTLIAQTHAALRVLETASPPTIYLPREDIGRQWLESASGSSLCEWKGQASYWSVRVDSDNVLPAVAWSYEEPFPEFQPIAGYISFYPAALECYLAGVRVQPQPGGLYGGWVTPEIVGPYKGNPGTESW